MGLSDKQLENAAIVIRVGQDLGATRDQIVAALSAAWVESEFGRTDGGDHGTAWGIFQQRHVAGWGTKEYVENPYNAAASFFGGYGPHRGLLDKWVDWRAAGENVWDVQRSKRSLAYRYTDSLPLAGRVYSTIKGLLTGDTDPQDITPGTSGESVSAGQSAARAAPFVPNKNLARVLALGVGLILIILAGVKLSG